MQGGGDQNRGDVVETVWDGETPSTMWGRVAYFGAGDDMSSADKQRGRPRDDTVVDGGKPGE